VKATSPYLAAAARRVSLQIVPMRAPVYATTCEHPYRFARSRSDGLPLEKSKPVAPLWKDILAGVLTMFAIAVVVVVLT